MITKKRFIEVKIDFIMFDNNQIELNNLLQSSQPEDNDWTPFY